MRKKYENLKFIVFVSFLFIFCFAGISYAVNQSSSVRINNVNYPQGMALGSNPAVGCILSPTDSGTSISLSFVSGKRGVKNAFASLNFILSPDEYNNLMAGDTLNLEHGNNPLSFLDKKVFLIFSEGSARKTRAKLVSTSLGTPTSTSDSYLVMGTVEILNKREDGCIDVSFTAVAQNASLTRSTTNFDTMNNNCIRDTMSETLMTVPSTNISGRLYPEKFTPSEVNSSSGSTLCNPPSSTSSTSSSTSSTSSSTSGTIPDFGSSSGFTIPGFGSSGFTIPGFGSSGFTIPSGTDTGDGSDTL